MKRTRGNRIVALRGDTDLHAKIDRIVDCTGADKSTVVRTALEFLSEAQIVSLININRKHEEAKEEVLA